MRAINTIALAMLPFMWCRVFGVEGGSPAFEFRECYCPAHFGNSYEAMGAREMAAYLAELKWMGFNRYGDWMTTTDVRDPYLQDRTWHLGQELLDRKKKAFRAAQDLGMKLNLIVTPNHVYLDQVRPGLEAKKDQRIFGQLICPSLPEGRAIILENFRRWFDDLADAGLNFDAFTAFAYDYGGCACDRCSPWILTFAALMREVHGIAARRHKGIEPWFCSWWWTAEEHALFNDWASKQAPGWLKGMTLHIEYGKTRFKEVEVPPGCRKLAFVHIGYGDKRDNEVYGRYGPVIAPGRIPQTLQEIASLGAAGFQAYSEGVFDDANKALLAGIGSGRYRTADDVLGAYASRYFGAPADRTTQWSRWLTAWGTRGRVPLPGAAEEFERISAGLPESWRLAHWRIKIELEDLERRIGKPKPEEWDVAKLELAERFFSAQERLYRDVYGLGPVRHVLNPRFLPPAWLDSWNKAKGGGKKLPAVQPEQ